MTKGKVERLVRDWQKRLKLDHWDVKVDWSRSPREDCYATTFRRNQYDIAELCFDSEYKTWASDFTEKLIVHELLHLLTRDLDRVVNDLEEVMHLETFRLLDKRYEHEIEGVVDRLASCFVEAVNG